jgi:hypothetical protein
MNLVILSLLSLMLLVLLPFLSKQHIPHNHIHLINYTHLENALRNESRRPLLRLKLDELDLAEAPGLMAVKEDVRPVCPLDRLDSL